MAVYKDGDKWRVIYRYTNYKGGRKQNRNIHNANYIIYNAIYILYYKMICDIFISSKRRKKSFNYVEEEKESIG